MVHYLEIVFLYKLNPMPYFERNIDEALIEWKNQTSRKPLLVRGARQVEFTRNSLFYNTPVVAGKTLVFLDEIQACIPAITSLRYFYEKVPDIHLIAAGSLLEFALNELPSFRVGRIMSDNENQMDEVSSFFTALGFEGADLAEGTTTISNVHADLYNPDMQRSEFRYLAKSEFTVRTRKIDLLQEALSISPDLISKGIILGSKNPWSPIEYIFTGLNEIRPPMIEEATKNAREVAEKFAHDSDSRVTTIDYQLED